MASSGNFCTLNPLDFQGSISDFLSNGNLKASTGANLDAHCHGTFGINADTDTQGYYYEVRIESRANNQAVGWARNIYYTGSYGASSGRQSYVMANGQGSGAGDVYTLNSVNTSFRQTFSNGDIVGVAIKGGKIWFAKNNTYINSGNPSGNTGEAITGATGTLVPVWYVAGGGTNTQYFNFGQDDTFGGAITGEGNTDENSRGVFRYAPPTGFLALCSANLPTSTDIDPAETDDDFPQKQFNAITWTGNRVYNSTVNNITGVGFQPDLVWLKFTEQTYDWRLVDSSRGVTKAIRSNKTTVEQTEANGIYQFDSDGFSVKGDNNYNYNGGLFIGYCFKAKGGTTVSNGDGSITSTVQANTKAGFSIITFTSPNNSSDQTVGHGLTKAPEFIISKNLDSTYNWDCFHIGLSDTTKGLRLNTTDVPLSGRWGTVNATTIGTKNAYTHSGTDDYVFYAWHSVEGFSKFGIYEGLGGGNSATDNIFVYTGFRPRLIFVKNTESSSSWIVYDTAQKTFNPMTVGSAWNETTTSFDTSNYAIDILSNGWKFRTGNATVNSAHTWVYGAWGDASFKYNQTF